MKILRIFIALILLFSVKNVYSQSFTGSVSDVELTLQSVKKKGYLEVTFKGINQSDEDQELFIYSYGCKLIGDNGKEYKYDGAEPRKTFPPGVPLLYTVTFHKSAKNIKKIAYLKLDFRYKKETLTLKNIPVPFSSGGSAGSSNWNEKNTASQKEGGNDPNGFIQDFDGVSMTLEKVYVKSGFLVFSFRFVNNGSEEVSTKFGGHASLIGDNGKEYRFPRMITYDGYFTFPPGVPIVKELPMEKSAARLKKISYLKFDGFGQKVVLKNIPNPYKK